MENDTSGTERASKLKAWRISPMAIAFGLVALLLAWQWYDGGNRIGALRDELAQRVRESESDSRDARLAARQAQEAAREAQAKLAQSMDVRGMRVKRDEWPAGVFPLPLGKEARPRAPAAARGEADGLWERLVGELPGELKQLVKTQNMEGPAPALLSPPQAFFL